jgi:signal transduction histidine kinase
MSGVSLDMTDRRRAEDALRDADRRKDDFLALLAHELRNPLAPLRNGLQLLRHAEGPDARGRTQEMMERQLGTWCGSSTICSMSPASTATRWSCG